VVKRLVEVALELERRGLHGGLRDGEERERGSEQSKGQDCEKMLLQE
jgi:hypothetical protein